MTRTKHLPQDRPVGLRFRPDAISTFLDNPTFPREQAPELRGAWIEIEGQPTRESTVTLGRPRCTRAQGADHRRRRSGRVLALPVRTRATWASGRDRAAEELDRFVEGYRRGLVYQTKLAGPVPYRPQPPREVLANPTRSFRWHALDHVRLLLYAHEQSGDAEQLDEALEAWRDWHRHVYLAGNRDKYVWYDHGVAERALVLLQLAGALAARGDETGELVEVLSQHLDLLADQAFYVRQQPFLHHNHGIFQDIAVMELARHLGAPELFTLGAERAIDQFEHLVTDQGVLVENSTGYQKGLLRVCTIAARTAGDQAGPLPSVCDRMRAFATAMPYPDGTLPAFGDTVWTPNARRPATFEASDDEVFDYADSGYLIRRGTHGGAPYQLFFGAPNRTTTHKHEDHLGFTFWVSGVELLTDVGYYVGQDREHRAYARSVRAHNAVWIPGAEYDLEPGRATLELEPDGRFAGVHAAYSGLEVHRAIELSEGWGHIELAVADEVGPRPLPPDPPQARLRLHLGGGVRATPEGDGGYLLEHSRLAGRVRLDVEGVEACALVEGSASGGWAYPAVDRSEAIQTLDCPMQPNLRARTRLCVGVPWVWRDLGRLLLFLVVVAIGGALRFRLGNQTRGR